MPAKTPKQARAAGAELGRRKAGAKVSKTADRPFAGVPTEKLKHFTKTAGTKKKKK